MPVAVITGASSGIGKATAEEFSRQGYDVVVVARRKALLDALVKDFPGKTLAIQCDVSDWAQVVDATQMIVNELGGVNVLINNAGAFEYAPFEKSDPKKIEEMINVNIRGVIYMTKALLPHFKTPAKIVNVSSIGGLWGFSNMAVYTATKFAVTGFTSALRRELRAKGIEVASIHPGPVRNREDQKGPTRGLTMLPPQVARQIVDLATNRRGRHVSHPAFTLLNLLEHFSPTLVDRVLKRIL